MRVSIIIVNYNGKQFLKACLDSVLAQSYTGFEIVLVDNNSSDGSIDFVCDTYTDDRIKVLKAKKNLGFSGGNNLGYSKSSGELIVLLNNDTTVDKDWLRYLVEMTESDENIGVTQSLVITEGIPERFYKQNGTVNILGHNIMEVFPISGDGTGEIFQANGCSLILKRKLVEKLGGLFIDEYFAYAEDTYLCFKVKFYGKRIMHTSKSVVHHKGNQTSKKQRAAFITFLQERNRLLNFLLFFSRGFLIKYIPYLLFNLELKVLVSIFSEKYSLSGILRAYWWLATHYGWLKEHRCMLSEYKKVPDKDVLKYVSGRLFNGENLFVKLMNGMSVLYCRLVRINVLEVNKH